MTPSSLAAPRRLAPRALGAIGLTVALLLSLLVAADASSHREAPLITEDPVADNTDVYAFVSPDRPNTVTLISNWIPFEFPPGGPNFYNFGQDVLYTIQVDNDGDAVDDIVYEFRFRTEIQNPDTFLYATGPIESLDDEDFNLRQFYDVTEVRDGKRTVLGRNLPVPPNNVGPRSTPNYSQLAQMGVHRLDDGMRVFAGQRDEAFPIDIAAVFDLGGLRPFNPEHIIPLPRSGGKPGTNKFNVHSIALQIPTEHLVESDEQPVIGVYSTTSRREQRVFRHGDGARPVHSGDWVQVSRLGNPLVNEVIIPLKDKDKFNSSEPSEDAQFLEYVRDPILGEAIPTLYPVFDCFPEAPRNDLVTIFLTGIPDLNQIPGGAPAEYLRLNTSIPPTPVEEQDRLGLLAGQLDGFPNGRRLVDDVTDIELQAIAGATPLGECEGESPNDQLNDGVPFNDKEQLGSFPYIPGPWEGYADQLHRTVPLEAG